MDVLTRAWHGAGCPTTELNASKTGRCARCGDVADLTPVNDVVSKNFTGFEDWKQASRNGGLCATCAWGLSTRSLRTDCLVVESNSNAFKHVDRTEVYQLLASRSLTVTTAVIVPLKPGRKHLLPTARWGTVTIDDANLRWTDADASRLRAVAQLRTCGFGSRMILEPAPAFSVLRKMPPGDWAQTQRTWHLLDPWRSSAHLWLTLALHLTQTREVSR